MEVMWLILIFFLSIPHLTMHSSTHLRFLNRLTANPQTIRILSKHHQVRHVGPGPQLSFFAFQTFHPIVPEIPVPALGVGQLLLWLVEACVGVP